MDHLTYKQLHENFTSNHNGTTPLETFMVVLPSLLGGSLVTAIRSLVGITISDEYQLNSRVFWMEFVCMISPAILSFTVLSDFLFILSISILIMWWSVLCFKSISSHKNPQNFIKMFQEKYFQVFLSFKFASKRRPVITNFRSFTNMLTVLCILAVDFPMFPRRFAKTETYGYGVMDIGVGLFVISNALVSHESHHDTHPLTLVYRLLTENFPLLVLGTGRSMLTSFLGYQEHVTEYGSHWNFFFTLAATKIFCGIIIKFIKGTTKDYTLLSGSLIVSYEFVLHMGLRDWIFSDAPRVDFVSANREGIVSLVGYIALCFSGLSMKKVLNKRDKLTGRSNISLIYCFSCWSCVFWVITVFCGNTVGVSRRLANLGYFLWVLSFSTTFISLFVFFESIALLQNIIFSSQKETLLTYPPILCEAINYYGLVFFLLGNILTGLVNLSVRTLFLGPILSLCVLTTYMFVICVVVRIMYQKKLHFKN